MSSTSFSLNSEIVRAGAGAGKTTRLTQKIHSVAKDFFHAHGRWPKLVITTFTRKATQELRERLIIKACDEKDQEFLSFLTMPGQVHISTIHGVLGLFLRRYGHLLGWDTSFRIMGKAETAHLSKMVLRELIYDSRWELLHTQFSSDQLLELLNGYYESYLTFGQLKGHDHSSLAHLHCTYINRLVKDVQKLAAFIETQFTSQKWCEFATHLQAVAGEWVQRNNLNHPLAGEEALEVLKERAVKPRKTKDIDEGDNEFVTDELKKIRTTLAQEWLNPNHWLIFSQVYQQFSDLGLEFVERLLIKKRELAQIEMKDLELLVADICRKEPDLIANFSRDWDYWLIDEYQDTSPLQDELLERLIGDRPVFLVGDPQQSIYLFRGARAEVFARKQEQLAASSQLLLTNYRSSPELMSFINDFFSGFVQKFMRMDVDPQKGVAQSKNIVAHFCRMNSTENNQGLEDQFIAQQIKFLVDKGARPDEICILARKHVHLKPVASILNGLGLPTHIHAPSGYFSRREILDAVGILKFLVNPYDTTNLVMLLRSPWLHVSDQQIAQWAHEARAQKQSFWTFLSQQDNSTSQRLNNFIEQVRKLGAVAAFKEILVDLGFIDLSHYHDVTGRRESNLWKLISLLHEAERRPGFSLNQFLHQNQQLLSEDSLSAESDAVAAVEPNSVSLMTVHGSKGLQFRYVFVCRSGKGPELSGASRDSGMFRIDDESKKWSFSVPTSDDKKMNKSVADQIHIEKMRERELQEHDRLMYVALTRARDKVWVTWDGNFHPHSWLGRSHFALEKGQHETSTYSYEVVDVDEVGELSAMKLNTHLSSSSLSKFVFTGESKRVQKISVSGVLNESLEKAQKNSEPIRSDFNSERLIRGLQAACSGNLLHSLFERLKYKSGFDFKNFIQNNFPQNEVGKTLKALTWAMDLEHPPMKTLIEQGEVEWGYQMKLGSRLVEGQIDLWGVVANKVWIVDYKSGHISAQERAMEQLELYSLAIRELGYKDIYLAALFPFEQEVLIRPASSSKEDWHN